MRGFEKVSYIDGGIIPKRGSKDSAGYDFSTIEEVIIEPNKMVVCNTGIKAFMQEDEVLSLHVRSSIGIKKGIILANITGIIDSDYYNNEDNEGHIMIALRNISNNTITLEKGEKIAQGIFNKYLVVDNEEELEKRTGGIGSTNK
ncbi:MAG: dCTP deaminase domain-containing protein [Mycoplasmatales bacterium]